MLLRLRFQSCLVVLGQTRALPLSTGNFNAQGVGVNRVALIGYDARVETFVRALKAQRQQLSIRWNN